MGRDLPAFIPSWAMTAMKVVKKKHISSLLIFYIFKVALYVVKKYRQDGWEKVET